MNRAQFIKELERLLSDLPYGERQEAIQYYNDYFDDAGPEKEAQVIAELGSPAKVAKTIREGMSEGGEYTEHGYEDARFRQAQELSSEWKKPEEPQVFNRCKGANPWKFFSILLLCLLLFPIILPLFLAFLGVIAAVILGICGLIAGAVVAAVALPLAGLLLIGIAVYNLFFLPAIGITLGGIGCLLLSAGILLFLLTVWCVKTILPLCIRSIVSIIRYPLRKAGIVR